MKSFKWKENNFELEGIFWKKYMKPRMEIIVT